MTFRTITALVAAVLAAAVPATATAKPPAHAKAGKTRGLQVGAFDRFHRAEREIVAVEDAEQIADETSSDVEETKPEKAEKRQGKGKGKGRAKGKMTVFKGTIVSADADTSTVVVKVAKRNRWARVFRGEELTFTLETARIQVADTDGDGTHGVSDLAVADKVLVKARVARGAADDGSPIAALRLLDLTSPEEDEDDDDDQDEVVAPAPVETIPVDPAV